MEIYSCAISGDMYSCDSFLKTNAFKSENEAINWAQGIIDDWAETLDVKTIPHDWDNGDNTLYRLITKDNINIGEHFLVLEDADTNRVFVRIDIINI